MLSCPGTWEDYLIKQEAGGPRIHTAQTSLLVKGVNPHLCEPRKTGVLLCSAQKQLQARQEEVMG